MDKISIFLTRPFDLLRMGGVTEYVRQLVEQIDKERFNILNLKKNATFPVESSNICALKKVRINFNLLLFMLLFPYRLFKYKPEIIHSNPSFSFIPILREAYFILWSAIFRKRIIVFIHGWNVGFERTLKSSRLSCLLFQKVYNLSDVILVLSQDFAEVLKSLNIKTQIIIETTMVNDSIANQNEVLTAIQKKQSSENVRILFLSRIEKTKGIYEAIKAFKIVSEKVNVYDLSLAIAGSGPELSNVVNFVKRAKISNVNFLGYIRGERKKSAYLDADIFLFPTYYGEGMPIVVLEAMYCGLPVITRRVGGLKDFFVNGAHGYITDSKDPRTFAHYLENLSTDSAARLKIAQFNHEYATKHFLASVVVKRLEKIYFNLMERKKHAECNCYN